MKKLYCKGKKDFCTHFDGEKLPTCHIFRCAFIDGSGVEVVDVPNTNYDRIKNMSVDEMERFFIALGECDMCACDNCVCYSRTAKTCVTGYTREWLESEVG